MASAAAGAGPDTPGPKGSVADVGGAGVAEARQLMIGALGDAGRTIAARAAAVLPAGCGAIVVTAGEAIPDFAPLDQFDLARAQLTARLDALLAAEAAAEPVAPSRDIGERDMGGPLLEVLSAAVNPVNAAASVVKAVAAAAQFFAVQTTFTGLALQPDDAVLLREVAGALVAAAAPRRVAIAPVRNDASRDALFEALQALDDRAAHAGAVADALDGQADATARAAALRAAAAAATGFREQLIKADGAAPSPLATIIDLHALRAHLADGGAILATHVAAAGGGLLTRTGLFLGILRDAPNRVFGLAVAGYTLVAGADRQMLAAGNVRASSGYESMRDIGTWGNDPGLVRRGG